MLMEKSLSVSTSGCGQTKEKWEKDYKLFGYLSQWYDGSI